MAADELQRLSRKYKLSPESDFFGKLVELISEKDYSKVKHVVLYSIKNFVTKLDEDSRDYASKMLYDSLQKIVNYKDNSDAGKRDRRIILES